MDFLNGAKRTKLCGEFRASDIGNRVTVMGFVAKHRNLGNLMFMDIRDRSGIVQVAFDDTVNKEVFDKATQIRSEYVVCCSGVVRSREGNINKTIPTGEIEVLADEVKILSEADNTPFVINEDIKAGENLRMKYRYLDLRRNYLQSRLVMRDKIAKATRKFFDNNGFLEIETPILGRSTPEGARDYLVPSRVHQGKFYALPQSPQQYKQLLMIAGLDRYYQIAKCFRDEDLRANRQPEFTQIDVEMSYVETSEDVMEIGEGLVKTIFNECLGMQFNEKFRRITYKEAMERWGSDKPDTRFGLELVCLDEVFANTQFTLFKDILSAGGSVRAINGKGLCSRMTRKEVDACAEFVKSYGLKGMSYAMLKEEGTTSSVYKNLSNEEIQSLEKLLNAEKGDVLFFVADAKKQLTYDALGGLRCYLADKYELYNKNAYDFLWVVDFPLLEYDDEEGRYVAVHHPFTTPKIEDIPLLETNPSAVRSEAYDLVINGQEAGGGSVRIHNRELQEKIFSLLGLNDEQIKEKFGYFVEAFSYGVPPHGGFAFGFDRIVMLVTKTDSIKDVIAFPKVQNASCLMTEAPSVVEDKQLGELAIAVTNEVEKE